MKRNIETFGWQQGWIASLFALLLLPLIGNASQTVTLAWDANLEPDLAGYKLYCGTASGTHSLLSDVGNVTTVTVSNLTEGATLYFVVTAYNTSSLESTPSNEISYTVPTGSSGGGSGGSTNPPVNTAPVASTDQIIVLQGGATTTLATGSTSILANDTDAESNPMSVVLQQGPSNGQLTLNTDGSFTYVHNGGASLTDSFTYTAHDATLASAVTTVSISVFRTTEIVKSGTNVLLRFNGVVGTNYRVDYTTNAPSSTSTWYTLVAPFAGHGGIEEITVANGASYARMFYRVVCLATGANLVTAPVGSLQTQISIGGNAISAPLHSIPTYVGTVSGVSSNTLTVAGTPWTVDAFNAKNGFDQYALVVRNDASAPGAGVTGDWWTINDTAMNTVTLNTRGENLTTFVSAGDTIEIRKLTSLADLFGTGSTVMLNKDANGFASKNEEDVIRYIQGSSFAQQVFYHNGTLAGAGYYVLSGTSLLGPLDGTTVTLTPDQTIMLFRSGNTAPPTTLTTVGAPQITSLTHYLNAGGNAVATGFAVESAIGTSGLKGTGWASDSDGFMSATSENIVRSFSGGSLKDGLFYHDGTLATAGWYVNGTLNNNYGLQASKGYMVYVKAGSPLYRWRQACPFAP